jgi:hypothetical protein
LSASKAHRESPEHFKRGRGLKGKTAAPHEWESPGKMEGPLNQAGIRAKAGRITLRDVAKKVGVSPVTISPALRNHPSISPKRRRQRGPDGHKSMVRRLGIDFRHQRDHHAGRDLGERLLPVGLSVAAWVA